PKHNIIDPVFLKYYLMWEKTQDLLVSMVGEGITRITLSKKMIEDLEINIPPLEEQKKIASIISSLDYKIQLNDEVNKTLEQIAHAIFESWFVDFEPFKDKGFEKSQLGIIPKGWKVEKMACVVPVTDGTHDSPKKRESGYRLLTSKHIKNNKVQFKEANFISEEDFIKINKRSKVEKFDVLITMIGTIGNTLLVQDECINYAIKNIGLIKTSLNRGMAEFIFMYLSSDRIKNYIKTKVTGNGQPYISLGNLKDVPVVVPSANVIDNFQKIVSKLYKKIEKNNTMNENLTSIRDKILSKLMLGEVIVKKYS
ncbi:restriction endonuclease subunit S, partial [Clostridium sp. WILCCON 0269]